MIPKTLHYCWFGRNPLPRSAKRCISSWKRYFPDYEIIQWNEDNFDVDSILYTSQAYQAKKFAFVSDYARYKILYENGGIYFDTDVEVIRPFDDLISAGSFMGFEINPGGSRKFGAVAPGLGMGAEKGLKIYEEILRYYAALNFIKDDGNFNISDAVVNITTRELIKAGLKELPGIQNIAGINIYPSDFFNPYDDITGKLNKTINTRSIHWYSKTWMNSNPLRQFLSHLYHRLAGLKKE